MKNRVFSTIGIIVASVFIVSAFFISYRQIQKATIRLDKTPLIGPLLLQLDKPAGFDATVCKSIITWEQLDNPPPEFDAENNQWFYLNPYTKWLLKNYMRENNLGIIPANYPNFHLSADFDECLETFRFTELSKD